MSNPRISVIVPVYNSELCLPRCVDSILAQTFTDFEVLLVDDGSTDSSGKICEDYVRADNRVRLFSKRNGGVSSARNTGLDNAKGEWICFVDSDDAIRPEFFSNCIGDEKEDVDVIFCGFIFINRGHIVKKYIFDDTIYKKNINLHDFFTDVDIMHLGVPWGKLYRRRVIIEYDIKFDLSLSISEDKLFFYQFLTRVDAIQLKSYVGYAYYCSGQGLSSRPYDFDTNRRRYVKLNDAAKLLRNTFHLTAKEYFPFWHQQLIYLSILFDSNNPQITNPFVRARLDKDIYKKIKKMYDWQFSSEAKQAFVAISLLKKGKFELMLIVGRQFFLYELCNLCKRFLKTVLRRIGRQQKNKEVV